jgi:DNA-binding NarL/FixJ family response regulator
MTMALYKDAVRSYERVLKITREVRALQMRRQVMDGQGGSTNRQTPSPKPLESPASKPPSLDVLTHREREVAGLIAHGLTNQQIAETLVIEPGTAANHVAHILSKVGVRSRLYVALWFLESER